MKLPIVAAAAVLLALPALAQEPGHEISPPPAASTGQTFDPPQREYANGSQAMPAAVERSLAAMPSYRGYLPPSVDLSSSMPPVGDQGRSQSCEAWAVGYARSAYTAGVERRDLRQASNFPSPNYVFQLAREGDWGCTDGTNLLRVVEVLKAGALSLADYPFVAACRAPAPPELVARAKDFRVQGFNKVDLTRMDDIKGQLAQRNPIIISFNDSSAWHQHRGAGVFNEVKPRNPNGWHAMAVIGYDEARQAVRLINSWGPGWGDRGYAWMSYDVVRARVRSAFTLAIAGAPVASLSTRAQQPGGAGEPTPPGGAGGSTIPSRIAPSGVAPAALSLAGDQATDAAPMVPAMAGPATLSCGHGGADAAWPLCELRETLAEPLNAADAPKLSVGVAPAKAPMVQAPAHASYLYVAAIAPDGSVTHLLQPRRGRPATAGQSFALAFTLGGGSGKAKHAALPSGALVVALASDTPLFEGVLPARQTEREYLTALRRAQLARATPRDDGAVAAAIVTVGAGQP